MDIKPLVIGDLEARVPVIQGGMGVGISLSNLAGAVAASGGIGVIASPQIGYRDMRFDANPIETNLRVLKEEIRKAKEMANGGIIAVNIMVVTRCYERYVEAAVEGGADLIISGAGLPMKLPELVGRPRSDGNVTKIAPIVSSVKSADVICKYWLKKYNRLPDLVVAEGPQAGGHLGFTPAQLDSMDYDWFDEEVRAVIACVNAYAAANGDICPRREIPVVAAGGIYTREDMEHYLQMGASGVQMGTRFVTTYECDAADAYKQAYIKAEKNDIGIVKSPVGMPGRAILNSFINKTNSERLPYRRCHLCVSTCKPDEIPYCITDALVNAAIGNIEEALLFCGTNAYRAAKLEYVRDIMAEFAP